MYPAQPGDQRLGRVIGGTDCQRVHTESVKFSTRIRDIPPLPGQENRQERDKGYPARFQQG